MSRSTPTPPLQAADIRRKYIEFFVERAHTHVPSSPLVPPDDPTMLFTSAGMVQFKALYSGATALPYPRAATVQKCLRAGGKGSDLENVGKTLRHHTFFEMLGNFSFGDYFKREAIEWAWEFCTDPKWLGLPGDRIWATVFGKRDEAGQWDVDDDAEAIWRDRTGVVNPIVRLDEKENFWGPAGETGACGPCSEIKFFMGDDALQEQYRQWAASDDPTLQARVAHDIAEEGDLFLEIWNLVFPQFDQQPDGSRRPLANRGIDTGMGLERTTTAVQFVQSGGAVRTPYESDLLRPLVDAVSELAALPYPIVAGDADTERVLREKGLDPAVVRLAMNACADHARTLTFTLAEGIAPSNEGRGYVLRRILRRAARFGKKLGLDEPFLWRLVARVVECMGDAYPDLGRHIAIIEKTIRNEEERFNRTLNQGGERLDQLLAALPEGGTLDGDDAYILHDTFGYPLDLTIEAAEERGLGVDVEGFERALARGRKRARASWKGGGDAPRWRELLGDDAETQTEFTGYDTLESSARVVALIHNDTRCDALQSGQTGVVVLDRTPCYAEAGGQVGDRGWLTDEADDAALFTIEDTRKTDGDVCLHFGTAEGTIRAGQALTVRIDAERRADTARNHSATHLMQSALKAVVGDHVTQRGSFVGPEGLRFDFTHPEPVGDASLRAIEALVNEYIRNDAAVDVREMSLENARAEGAIAPFGEKYGATVRVVTMGDVSKEFCGGAHVARTGRIGLFVIVGESSVASGIRRIEALAGRAATAHVARERAILAELSRRLSTPADELPQRLDALQDEVKTTRREMERLRAEQARRTMAEAAEGGRELTGGIRLVVHALEGASPQALAGAWDALKQKSPQQTVGVFHSSGDGKVALVVGVTDDLAPKRLKAGDIMREAAGRVGGKGGGKPTLARGGGTKPECLDEMIEALPDVVENLLK